MKNYKDDDEKKRRQLNNPSKTGWEANMIPSKH